MISTDSAIRVKSWTRAIPGAGAILDSLLTALADDPGDDCAWLALADVFEEADLPQQAELTRLREWLRKASFRSRGRRDREQRMQQLLAAGVRPIVPELIVSVDHQTRLEFCLIPPGSFWMGSPRRQSFRYPNEGPRHFVRLTRGFWLGRTALTVQQWQTITNAPPNLRDRSADLPATGLSWDMLREACRSLRSRTGLPFRLPTEAEWEYACRATTRTPFCSGSTQEDANRVGWHMVDSKREQHPVELKEPNAWGLFDMHGSVWEWCLDGRRPFSLDDQTDPVYELEYRTIRVLRGGSFENRYTDATSSCRGWAEPQESAPHWGARLALSLDNDDPLLRVFHR